MWCPSTADAKNDDTTIKRTILIYENDINFSILNDYPVKLFETILESTKHTDKFIFSQLN